MEDKPKAEVTDITQLAGKFKSRVELQKYAEMLFQSFKEAVSKLQKLEEENKHLKELLSKAVAVVAPASPVVKFEIPDEQAIAELQLQRLKVTAMERELTLDETKRLDLLVKNLYLSKGKQTNTIKMYKTDDVSDAELMSIAKSKDE